MHGLVPCASSSIVDVQLERKSKSLERMNSDCGFDLKELMEIFSVIYFASEKKSSSD